MGKRGNGEGSIYRRKDGRWVGQYLVCLPTGPKYRYIYGKTRKDVSEKLTRAMADRDQGLVFTSETGAILNPSNLRQRSFNKLLKKAGVPQIRFHDLRHTCATLLLSRNVHPKIVQEMLGHANVAITLDTYSHVLPGMGDQAASAMEDALL